MFELKGKVAIVTGSGRGIGAGIAIAFAKAGAKVVVASRHKDECDSTVKRITKSGGKALSVACDVSEEKEVKSLIDLAVKRFGKLDILVNNAGIYGTAPIYDMTNEQWKRVQSVDLDGTFLCTKYAAMKMKGNKYGRIINISSVAGLEGFAGSAAYCAAKFGVRGLTKAAAEDLAPYNITVNAICPGLIQTKMTESFVNDPKTLQQFLKLIPLNRVGKPEDIAAAALFLASDEAGYLTGSEIVVDGGWASHL